MLAFWCQLTTVKPIVLFNNNLHLWQCCFHLGCRLEWGPLFAILYLATERIEPLIRNEPCTRNPNGRCWRRVYRHVHLCVELQHKWEFLEAVWFNTSVSLAAVPAFHDSAFHHLKHVIAFDDNKRIVARERSTVSENTEPPALQVQSTSADVVLGQEGFQTQWGARGRTSGSGCLSAHFFQSKSLWAEIHPQYRGMMEIWCGRQCGRRG